jgi:hypothetical protein
MSLCGMPTCWARCATGRCLARSGTDDNGNEGIGFAYGLLMPTNWTARQTSANHSAASHAALQVDSRSIARIADAQEPRSDWPAGVMLPADGQVAGPGHAALCLVGSLGSAGGTLSRHCAVGDA